MAAKQTTQLCYQVNGGTCRNKVSASSYYICAAGHGAIKGMGRDEIATQLSVEAIRKMGRDAQCELAKNPSIDHEIAQALFDTGGTWVKRNLAKNPSIGIDIARKLFETRLIVVWVELAKNPSIDHDIAQALFDIRLDLRHILVKNPSIDHEIAQALFDMGEVYRSVLAKNPSIDRDMAVQLAKSGCAPVGYLKNKSINDLCNTENLSLLNSYPMAFGEAYLERLLNVKDRIEINEMKAILAYSYSTYEKAANNKYLARKYKDRVMGKYPNDEEIKILISQDS